MSKTPVPAPDWRRAMCVLAVLGIAYPSAGCSPTDALSAGTTLATTADAIGTLFKRAIGDEPEDGKPRAAPEQNPRPETEPDTDASP